MMGDLEVHYQSGLSPSGVRSISCIVFRCAVMDPVRRARYDLCSRLPGTDPSVHHTATGHLGVDPALCRSDPVPPWTQIQVRNELSLNWLQFS